MSSGKEVRMRIPYDSALKIQVWANSKGLSLPQACSLICEGFVSNEEDINKKLDTIIELLSELKK